MKRFVCMLFAILMASSYCLASPMPRPISVSRATSAITLDAHRLPQEYPLSTGLAIKNGLYLCDEVTNRTETSSFSDAKEIISCTLEGDLLYLAVEYFLPAEEYLATVCDPIDQSDCYCFEASLSLEWDPASDRHSLLRNRYYISKQTRAVHSVYGFRNEYLPESEGLSIRSFSPSDSSGAFRDESALLWDSQAYALHSAFRLEQQAGGFLVVAELCIPLSELILTVPISERSQVSDRIRFGKGLLSAGLITELLVSSPSAFSSDVFTLGNAPFSSDTGGTAKTPAPLYFSHSQEHSPAVLPSLGQDQTGTPPDSGLSDPPVSDSALEDELDLLLPPPSTQEDVEIVPITEEESEDESDLATLLAVILAVLVFAAAIVFGYYTNRDATYKKSNEAAKKKNNKKT